MPLVRANDALPERPVVIGYYGEPGVRKTSIAHTAETPLLIDFDRGVARSYGRKDAVIVDNWEEVLQYEKDGLYKQYKTIIIDTAKAALDDFLMNYVVKLDFKNAKNKLQAYGAIGEEFKRFLNARREEGVDVIIIAHAKKDEDTKKMLPDITGQSYNLMLRVADQVGYVSMKNNKATIQWYPTDFTVGKNTANLPEEVIPDKSEPAIKTFMADIIKKVKASIVEQSESQREALAKSENIQASIASAVDYAELSMVLPSIVELPAYLQQQLMQVVNFKSSSIIEQIKTAVQLTEALTFHLTKPMVLTKDVQAVIKKVQETHGWKFDKDSRTFSAPPPPEPPKQEYSEGLTKEIPVTGPAQVQQLDF